MSALLLASKWIDTINQGLGRWATWAVVLAIVVSAGNAVSRRFFGVSSNAWLELQWYLFGAVVLLCAAWTLKDNNHVRIDILTSRLSARAQDWLDLFGHVFLLLPFVVLTFWLSVPYFIRSFLSGEVSLNPGGLIIWPAKAMIVAGFATLLLQCISETIKRIAILNGAMERPAQPEADVAADAPAAATDTRER